MKPQVPYSRAALSPSGRFEAVPARCIQQVLQQWFEHWGRPQSIQFDHGYPWCAGNGDLPTLFELWLVGLDIDVVWSRVRCPQDNGIVERSHRTTQAWSDPKRCHSLSQLQLHLDRCVRLQRQYYPNRDRQTRLHRYPELLSHPRHYQRDHEPQLWSLHRVHAYLQQGCWQRKVDASGRISLYNRNYKASRALAQQTVWVRFDPTSTQWVILNDRAEEVNRVEALEINPTTICQLQQHRSAAKRRAKSSSPSP